MVQRADADLSALADGSQDAGVPADADEEAVEPHYAVPGVEATVYTENLQVGEGSVAAKDSRLHQAGQRTVCPACVAPTCVPLRLASLVEPARISLS